MSEISEHISTRKIDPPPYCKVCTVPYEYCQWSGSWDACKVGLKEASPELFALMYPELLLKGLNINETKEKVEAIESECIVEKTETVEKVEKKKKVKGGQVIIKKVSRSKRKCSILIQGLDAYGI